MKTLKITLASILLLTLSVVNAQTKGSGNVTTENREISGFNIIKVGCAIHLFISQGAQEAVKVETDDNLQDRVYTKVKDGTLEIGCNEMKNPTRMNVYVTVKELTEIEAEGASEVKSETILKSEDFGLDASGASKLELELETGEFNAEISGAAKATVKLTAETTDISVSGAGNLILTGNANTLNTEVSGAGNLKAIELITDNVNASVDGSGNAKVMARQQLKAELSGAGNIIYFDKNNLKKINRPGEYQLNFEGMENVKSIVVEEEDEEVSNSINFWESSPDEDSVSIVLNDDRIVVITDDSVRVRLGDRSIRIGDDGVQLNVRHKKRPKFDGHWDGFELVLNGLLNSDNKTEMPAGYENMDLNYGKSWGVNLNVWEQNFNLANQHLGLVTGLGISWNNYRFDKNVKLTMDNDLDKLVVTKENLEGVDYEKSKLVVSYLNVPLLLEYQTNAKSKSNSFHISGGVVGGLRIGSHTKRVYDDGSRQKDKDRDDFYLAPFKLDAVGKIGWGKINLVASYGITELFRENKGPQVYPFSIGICLTDF